MGTTTAENTVELGTTLTYKKGDIVFWGGQDPALGRMNDDYEFYKKCRFHSAKFEGYQIIGYDSLHYSYLRPATPSEKEILGDREFVRYIPK